MSHRRHKPKRNKRYVPKHVDIPVTQSLRDEFGIVLHSALTAAELGHFDKHQYDRIGQAINCIWGALELRPPKDPAVKLVIEGAMRAMNDAGRRGDATGIWVLRELEQAAILAGIHKAEEHLPKMSVTTLYHSMQQFKMMQISDELELMPSRRNGKTHYLGLDLAHGKDRTAVFEFQASDINSVTLVERDESGKTIVHKIVRAPEERTPA